MSPERSIAIEHKVPVFLSSSESVGEWIPERHAREVAERAERAARRILTEKAELIGQLTKNPGFSHEEANRCVVSAFEPIRASALMHIWEREIGEMLRRDKEPAWPSRTVVIGGGTIPQPIIQAFVAAAMVSRKVLCRPSRNMTLLLLDFIRHMEPAAYIGQMEAATLFEGSWPHDELAMTQTVLGAADAFVAFGSAPALAELTSYLRPEAERFLYGPRISFAALDLTCERTTDEVHAAMHGLAEDIAAYDQRGCLSPMALHLIGGSVAARAGAIDALAEELSARSRKFGFTHMLPISVSASVRALRAVYQMDPGGGRSLRSSETLPGWTLLLDEADASLRPTPGYQTLFVCPVADWYELLLAVRPMAGQLQAMGAGPNGAQCPETIRRELQSMGLSRICALGEMQRPPLDWVHDGNPFFPVRGKP